MSHKAFGLLYEMIEIKRIDEWRHPTKSNIQNSCSSKSPVTDFKSTKTDFIKTEWKLYI